MAQSQTPPPATPAVTPPPPKKKGMGLLAKLFLLLVLAVGIFCGVAATRPDTFKISRSVTVAAPPARVFDEVNNLKNFHTWNPFAASDPEGKFTYEGPDAGVGAAQKWSGNAELGEGTMTITESRSPELVKLHLVFVRPMADESDTDFTFAPEGDGTKVTWSMHGKMNFLSKCMDLVLGLDAMVGPQFEKGLASLKAKAEKPAAANSPAPEQAPEKPAEVPPATTP